MKLKNLLILLGTLTLLFGVGLPNLMLSSLGADMGAALFTLIAVPIAITIAAINFVLAYSLREGTRKVIARIMVLISLVSSAYFTFFFLATLYEIIIGPKAVVIIPNDFVGTFEIKLGKSVEPSWETRNKIYSYKISDPSKPLFVESGWMYCSFESPEAYPKQGLYSMRLFYENGKALELSDFKCGYVNKTTVETTSSATITSTSGDASHIRIEVYPKKPTH